MYNNAPGGTYMATRILRLPEVKNRTGLSSSSIYLRMSNLQFPQTIALGGRTVGWLESEIEAWLEEKIQLSRDYPI
jgi:prophage regulatory protein